MEHASHLSAAASRAYLAAIVDSSDDAIISKDLNGIIQSWNPGAVRVFGYTPEEIVGRSIRTIIPPDQQTEEDEVLRSIRRGQRVDHFETVRLRKDGSRVFISLTVSPIRDPSGTIIGASKVARDITANRLADLQLAGERRAFQFLAEGAPLSLVLEQLIEVLESQGDGLRASILLLDDDGHLRHGAAPSLPAAYNQAVSGLPIGPAAGSCGTAAYRRAPVMVADIAVDPLWAPYPNLRSLALAANLRACWSTPILSSQGRVLGTFALYFAEVRRPTPAQLHFTESVSRTVATLLELRRAADAQARLTALVNSSDDVIIGMTVDGLVSDWNVAAVQRYGYTAEEMVGQPVTRLIRPEDQPDLGEKLQQIRAGESVAPFDSSRLSKDGRPLDVSVKLSAILDEHGSLIGISSIHRDIADRRALERLQQEFLAMVTHELRSPLTAIRGFASILQRAQQFNPRAVEKILDESRVLERLVSDLLDASRIQVSQLPLQVGDEDLVSLVHAGCTQVQQTSAPPVIVAEAPDHPVVGQWDGVRIRQVLSNLLTNALKYSSGGEIRVRVEERPAEVQVDVVDQGQGIAAEHLPHVFERFYRVDARRDTARSVGLGLYIARGIVERHGGRIWARSEGENRGSTFSFTLPYRAPAASAAG